MLTPAPADASAHSWGWGALLDHTTGAAADCEYKSKYKLLLAPGRSDEDAAEALRCFTAYLKELAPRALDHVRRQLGEHVSGKDVQWLLTVPAIWDDAAKGVMRDAFVAAGLIKGADDSAAAASSSAIFSPHPLLMVPEPEAASIFCQTRLPLPAYDLSLVCDCGGGTVDIVVHRKQEDVDGSLRLREMSKGSGNVYGGTVVDDQFVAFLSTAVPPFAEYAAENPREVLRCLMAQWELKKRTFTGDGEIDIDLPASLARLFADYKVAHYEEFAANDDDDEGYGHLTISASQLRAIFDTSVDRVLSLIEEQLTQLASQGDGGVACLFLVGGFAASPYLAKRVRERFSARIANIKTPPMPGVAVLEGAVLYGLAPAAITSRRARKTYGVAMTRPWCEETDAGQCDKYWHGEAGEHYADDVFDRFVSAGDELPVGKVVSRWYEPAYSSQTVVPVRIFSTASQETPKCVLGRGVRPEGDVFLEMATTGGSRPIKVSFVFGETEVRVVETDVSGGVEKAVSISFIRNADGFLAPPKAQQ